MKILKIYIINIYMKKKYINNKKWIIINNNIIEIVWNKIMT